jgi:AcrR family transcriptional regulator
MAFTLAKGTIVHQVSAVNPLLSRRERVRATTRSELTAAARELLLTGGTEAVTVRSIAAELGMTAPAIYRYFDSREALLNALIDELYDEVADHLYAVREARPAAPLRDRFLVTARAFRTWALQHRAEFGLLFGAPIPGVGVGLGAPASVSASAPGAVSGGLDDSEAKRGKRFGTVWLELFVELAARDRDRVRWRRPIPPGTRDEITRYLESIGGVVDIDTALLYLSCWQKLYGAVCTEAFGHLQFALQDGEVLFEDQLSDVAERLGIADD